MNGLTSAILGLAAAVCSMTSFAPQLIKLWREMSSAILMLRFRFDKRRVAN
jgi:PQ loop repeat